MKGPRPWLPAEAKPKSVYEGCQYLIGSFSYDQISAGGTIRNGIGSSPLGPNAKGGFLSLIHSELDFATERQSSCGYGVEPGHGFSTVSEFQEKGPGLHVRWNGRPRAEET